MPKLTGTPIGQRDAGRHQRPVDGCERAELLVTGFQTLVAKKPNPNLSDRGQCGIAQREQD